MVNKYYKKIIQGKNKKYISRNRLLQRKIKKKILEILAG